MLCGEDGRTWWSEGTVGWFVAFEFGVWLASLYTFEYMVISEYRLNKIGQASLDTLMNIMFRVAGRSAKTQL